MVVQKLNLIKLSAALLLAGVSQVDTAGAACPNALTPTSRMHGFGAATNTIAVSAGGSCAWSAVAGAPWITILSGSGSGNGAITYALAGNPNPGSRTGVIQVGGANFAVTQSGVTCTYSISPTFRDKCPNATTGSVHVATQSPCNWSVVNTNDWILITEGASGTGSGRVYYSVLSNETATLRSGVVVIAGQSFTINQAAAVAITCLPDKQVECGTPWTFDPPLGGTAEIVSTVTNALCGGSFRATRTWSSSDICGHQNQCSQTDTVLDLTPPVAVCPPSKSVGCGAAWDFDAPTGTDSCSGPVAIEIVSTITNGTGGMGLVATRTWRLADTCGNAATCSQSVTFTNGTAIVTCPPDRMVPCNATWNFDEPTVSGGCGAVITIVSTTTNVTCNGSYTATRTWQIFDGVTTTTCVQTISSLDQTPPIIVCPPDITVISTNDAPHCPKTRTEFIIGGGQISDECGAVTYQCMDGPFAGGPCGGVIERTHVAVDSCGNTNSCKQYILVLGVDASVSIVATNAAGETNPCAGGTLTFCATVTGIEPIFYVWMLDNQPIPGETNSCLTITNLSPVDVGRYSLQVITLCETITETLALPGCAPAPVLGAVQFMPAGVHVAFKGEGEKTYLILCSPGYGKSWNVIGTATTGPDGNGEFIDPFATASQCRMYRLADPGGN